MLLLLLVALLPLLESTGDVLYEIKGHITLANDPGWQAITRVSAGSGEYIGYVLEDGSFTIPNVKPG